MRRGGYRGVVVEPAPVVVPWQEHGRSGDRPNPFVRAAMTVRTWPEIPAARRYAKMTGEHVSLLGRLRCALRGHSRRDHLTGYRCLRCGRVPWVPV